MHSVQFYVFKFVINAKLQRIDYAVSFQFILSLIKGALIYTLNIVEFNYLN